jgi:hypothetical protein
VIWDRIAYPQKRICPGSDKRHSLNKTEKSFSNLAASQFCFSRSNKSTTTLQFCFLQGCVIVAIARLPDCCIARLRYCCVARLRDCCVARLRDCCFARLRDCCVVRLRDCCVARLRNYCFARLRDCCVARLCDCCVARLRDCCVVRLRDCCVARLRNYCFARLRDCCVARLCDCCVARFYGKVTNERFRILSIYIRSLKEDIHNLFLYFTKKMHFVRQKYPKIVNFF